MTNEAIIPQNILSKKKITLKTSISSNNFYIHNCE